MRQLPSRILKITGKILLWIIALSFIAVPLVVINKLYGYLLILFVLILIGISAVCMLILKKKIVVDQHKEQVYCRRGEDVSIDMNIRNTSILSCPRLEANIYITDLFGSYSATKKSRFMLAGRESVGFGFDSGMNHIGVYSIGIDKVRIYDFTGFFHTDIEVDGKFSACIMPRIRHMEELHISEDITAETSSNTRITVVGGTDYTGVREYEIGDPMKQIHWKLSAHTREYMTKLQESNRQQEYSVILDFASIKYDDHDMMMDVNDTLIETALSLIDDISGHDAGFKLLYCSRKKQIERIIPAGRSNDLEMITDFIPVEEKPDELFPDAATILREEEKGQNRASNILVVTSRPTDELVQELIRVKSQRRSPELYLVVPSGWNERQIEDLKAPLKLLEEYSVAYFIITTDINLTGEYKGKENEDR